MPDDAPAPLDYATPAAAPGPSVDAYESAIDCWRVVAIGGVTCVAFAGAARLFDSHHAAVVTALVGLVSLVQGGIVTMVGLTRGIIYAIDVRHVRYRRPHTAVRAAIAVLLPLSNVPLAVFCIVVVSRLLDAPLH